jgi:methylamine dehydrogenase accessory protein MauD
MIDALIVSNIVLWIAVVALSVLVFALVRQIGVLHERVAPAGALMGSQGPRVGEPAPVLQIDDWSGRRVTVGGTDDDGKSTLLFFLSPTCPVCKTLLPVLDSVERSEQRWLRLVLASDGPRAEHEAFVRQWRLDARPYVLSAVLGLTYQVGKLPYAVLIDAAGLIRAKGLVNTREHIESLFEAMERGVESVQEYLRRKQRDAEEDWSPDERA